MREAFDLVIRGGTVVDGSGAEAYEADVAVRDGRFAAIGAVDAYGREEIDARGMLVTPGFVDLHTHYDGQATWDSRFTPSSNHGVTTVLMGNCGVGFAPCRPEQRDMLINLMEGVEDIPEIVMTEGIPWNWESFPEYLHALARRRTDIDFAAMVPHAPVRVYVMGDRGANREPATTDDVGRMCSLVREGLAAGALGFSTSRTLNHRTSAGELIPTQDAGIEELEGVALTLALCGHGVFQLITDFGEGAGSPAEDFELLRRVTALSRRPTFFTLLDLPGRPGQWRELLDLTAQANADGLPIKGQVFPRPIGSLLGLDLSAHPFSFNPSYQALRSLPLAQKVSEMRRPELRARLLAEQPIDGHLPRIVRARNVEEMYALGDPPEYEPRDRDRIGVRARQRGMSPLEMAYEVLLERDGHAILYNPVANFVDRSLESTLAMMRHPDTLIGLGDGGAHYGSICDASFPTFMLAHWTRDRRSGERLPLAAAVRYLSRDPANAVGMNDRGVVAVGYKADVNVIDYSRLKLRAPYPSYDLPAGGRRLCQEAEGFVATIVSGVPVSREGKSTGAFPGRLVRGLRSAAR